MAISVGAPRSTQQIGTQHTDYRAMSIATMLFFMWGFLTCLNDILIPHLKAIFDLNYGQALLVQFCFFMSYAVFALPSGKLVEWRGYKGTMVIGLLVMAAGALGAATLLGVLLTSVLQAQLKYALPLSAGVTVYVAATDLLPEVNREPGWRTALLVFGGVAMLLILQWFVRV